MNEATTNPTSAEGSATPSESTAQEPPKQIHPKVELSPGVRAFIHRMAENLNTHDPNVPKGRNRRY